MDGDLDLYLSTNVSTRLLINNGSGFFVDVAANLGLAAVRTPALVDVDNDGACLLCVCVCVLCVCLLCVCAVHTLDVVCAGSCCHSAAQLWAPPPPPICVLA